MKERVCVCVCVFNNALYQGFQRGRLSLQAHNIIVIVFEATERVGTPRSRHAVVKQGLNEANLDKEGVLSAKHC